MTNLVKIIIQISEINKILKFLVEADEPTFWRRRRT